MSNLQRSFVKAKLGQLPAMAPDLIAEAAREENDRLTSTSLEGDYDDSSSSASSTGTIKPLPGRSLQARPSGLPLSKTLLDPLPWTAFFDQELSLDCSIPQERMRYHAYFNPPAASGPLFVAHHGAGSSGLSFATLASEIKRILPEAGILAPDARGHGETVLQHTSGCPPQLDFSFATLSRDLESVIRATQEKMGWSELPGIILVGHSLGGAVVTDLAKRGPLGDKVLGYAVLDVVEGSAIDALQSMQTYLSTRPLGFSSLEAGIEWHIRSRTIRDYISARVSVPALLHRNADPASTSQTWTWRTDLSATQPFWEDWFIGLSKKFLESRGGKLLLLAGTDRLDKELMIGQMQGKYQLEVIPEAGHFIHEDAPERTAAALVGFYRRNDRSTLVLPPKVSDLLKNNQLKGNA